MQSSVPAQEAELLIRRYPKCVLRSRAVPRWKPQERSGAPPKPKRGWCVHGHQDPNTEHLQRCLHITSTSCQLRTLTMRPVRVIAFTDPMDPCWCDLARVFPCRLESSLMLHLSGTRQTQPNSRQVSDITDLACRLGLFVNGLTIQHFHRTPCETAVVDREKCILEPLLVVELARGRRADTAPTLSIRHPTVSDARVPTELGREGFQDTSCRSQQFVFSSCR